MATVARSVRLWPVRRAYVLIVPDGRQYIAVRTYVVRANVNKMRTPSRASCPILVSPHPVRALPA